MMKKSDFLNLGNISMSDASREGILPEMSGTQIENKFRNYIPINKGRTRHGRTVKVGDELIYWDIRKKGRRNNSTPKENLSVGEYYTVHNVCWNGDRITIQNDLGKKQVVGTNRFAFPDFVIPTTPNQDVDPFYEEDW
jgi:hypothetical protein